MTPDELQQVAQMRAMALRGQAPQAMMQDADTFNAVGGSLAGLGPASVQMMSQSMAKRGDALRQLAIEAQRANSTEAHQATQEDLQRQQLEQGRWSLSNPAYGQPYKIDGKTGQIVPVGEAQARPERGVSATETEKQFEAFRKAISSTEGRGHVAVPLQQSINRAEAVEALIRGPNGEVLNLIPGQVREAATGLAQVIQQGGQPALQQIEEMTPHTYAGKFAEMKQKLLNEPTGADSQAFLSQMLETLAREKAVAMRQVRQAQLQNVPAFANLRKADKARFESMLSAPGVDIDPATIDDNGHLIQKPGAGPKGGNFDLSGSDTVNVMRPDGKVVPVHKANLPKALQLGGKVVTEGAVASGG